MCEWKKSGIFAFLNRKQNKIYQSVVDNIMKRKRIVMIAVAACMTMAAQGQGLLGGHVTGNVQLDGQMSSADSTIGAQDVPEKLLMNARADILYTNGDFSAGLRFEMYQNPLLGFDARYKGQGLANYFVAYNGERLSVTLGNFYEQFGSGMILRAYEDRYLGLDNALMGLNVQYRPVEGVTLKALAGKQRIFWDYGEGLVRGVDAEVNLGSLVKAIGESRFRATVLALNPRRRHSGGMRSSRMRCPSFGGLGLSRAAGVSRAALW